MFDEEIDLVDPEFIANQTMDPHMTTVNNP